MRSGARFCSTPVSSPALIRDLTFRPLDIPLFVPFGISGGAQPAANNVIARVELADGTVGFGEAAPLPPYNGETQADALHALAIMRGTVVGRDASDWLAIASVARTAAGASCGSAQCAFEMALLDALTRQRGQALWQFFGGASTTLETDMTVTTGTAEQAALDTKAIRERGIRQIKVKVGGAKGPAHDLERLRAIVAAAPAAPLILDGNAGVTREHARELVRGLREANITPALLEQWLAKDDLAGMRALREESGWLVAGDESACSCDDVHRLADAKAADIVNIKLMKAGVAAALDIVRAARERDVGLMIGGNVESILAMTFSSCFACGHGGFQFADLDTPWFLAENPFDGGFEANGGVLSVAHIEAGHGVVPKDVGGAERIANK
jgi:L-Ala-D/L-Glu epimerase